MISLETSASQVLWAAKNMAYNLDFIPADKLDWKPAPQANSALEIVTHVLNAFAFLGSSVKGTPPAEVQPVKTLEEAKERLVATAEEYAQTLRSLTPEQLQQTVELPFGKLPLGFVATMPVIDAIHHHGQLAYIQTLLGDTESHFDFSLLPQG